MREIASWADSRMTNSRIPAQHVQSTLPVAWVLLVSPPGRTNSWADGGHPVLTGKPTDHPIAEDRGSR